MLACQLANKANKANMLQGSSNNKLTINHKWLTGVQWQKEFNVED